ncbi:MAG: 50S ribosomal protein L18e [Candidatus Pacearchaeota archaeon]|nr:50S ribosomal protein L18e [Candidatus Pacearchaeota archaeon]
MIIKISKTKISKAASKKTNKDRIGLILLLKKQKNAFWVKIAKYISRPKRKTICVNLDKINKYGEPKMTILVPGKILSRGDLTKKLILSSLNVSEQAKIKIKESGSIYMDLKELLQKNPEAKDIKIII